MPPQGGLRQLDPNRVMTVGYIPPESTSAPPAVFTTTAIPQIRAQESTATFESGVPYTHEAQEENEYLHQRVEELENALRLSARQDGFDAREVAMLQQRLAQAQESEASALRQQEARLYEINELQRQLDTMRRYGGTQGGDQQRIVDLQRQLESARANEAEYARQVRDQQSQLQEQSRTIARSQNFQVSQSQQMVHERRTSNPAEQPYLRPGTQSLNQDNTTRSSLQAMQAQSTNQSQEYERTIKELKTAEDNYQKQLQEERRKNSQLEEKLTSTSKAKDFQTDDNESKIKQIKHLQDEVSYLQKAETFHQKQSNTHKKEVDRLKRLREEEAPPPYEPRMPLKALEERVMHLACLTMCGLCALPIIGALALLSDENYVFWLGKFWPWLIILGCVLVLLSFVCVMKSLFEKAQPEHRGQFTMAFTMATFTAFLGIVLVPMSLMANKDVVLLSGTISQGCLTSYPQSEMLVDYSTVLYNIRTTDNCTSARTVKECEGYAENKYTNYLEYLEGEFQCGPLCPESPPPARVVVAPGIWNNNPTLRPPATPPNMFGPPLQNALGEKGAFLQAMDGLVGRKVQLHEQKAARKLVQQPSGGVMESALPHMQAQKLFAEGRTRSTCYPLIATRLQVLVSTFGGLWYYQGIGLIVVSLLMSTYAGIYFATNIQ